MSFEQRDIEEQLCFEAYCGVYPIPYAIDFDKGLVDHDLYFTDLDGNRLELTTNDYDAVTAALE